MPSGDAEVIRDQFEAVNEREFARAMDFYADDVVLFVDDEAFLDSGSFEGKEAVGRWFGSWFSTFEPGYRFEIEEAREVGGSVLLVASHGGRGRSSGVEVEGRTAYLYTLRAGMIARVELYADRAAALEAAGADPDGA